MRTAKADLLTIWLMPPIDNGYDLNTCFLIYEEQIAVHVPSLPKPDIIVLPDFFCVFDEYQILKFAQFPGLQHYKSVWQMAKQNQAVVSVCLPVIEKKKLVRRNVWMLPQGIGMEHNFGGYSYRTDADSAKNVSSLFHPIAPVFDCNGWGLLHVLRPDVSDDYTSESDFDVLIYQHKCCESGHDSISETAFLASCFETKTDTFAYNFWQNRIYYQKNKSILVQQNQHLQTDILVIQLSKSC